MIYDHLTVVLPAAFTLDIEEREDKGRYRFALTDRGTSSLAFIGTFEEMWGLFRTCLTAVEAQKLGRFSIPAMVSATSEEPAAEAPAETIDPTTAELREIVPDDAE